MWNNLYHLNCPYCLQDFRTDTRRLINVGLMLVHRLRRWTNVKPTLIQRLVSAGLLSGTTDGKIPL